MGFPIIDFSKGKEIKKYQFNDKMKKKFLKCSNEIVLIYLFWPKKFFIYHIFPQSHCNFFLLHWL